MLNKQFEATYENDHSPFIEEAKLHSDFFINTVEMFSGRRRKGRHWSFSSAHTSQLCIFSGTIIILYY